MEDIKQHCQELLLHLRFHQWFKSKPVWSETTSWMSPISEAFNFAEMMSICVAEGANLMFPHFLPSANETYVRDLHTTIIVHYTNMVSKLKQMHREMGTVGP